MARVARILLSVLLVVVVAFAGFVWWILRGGQEPSEPEGTKRAATWSRLVDGTGPVRDAMVAGDAVLVQGETQLVVLDKADGRIRWHRPLERHRRVRTGAGGVATFSRESVKLYDLVTGEERYAQAFTGDVAVTTSTLVVNDCPATAAQCSITARDMTTGGQRWQRSYPRPAGWEQSFETVEVLGSPMVLGGNQRAESMATRAAEVVLVREGRAQDGTWKVTIRDITTGDPVGGYPMPDLTTWIVGARTMLAWDLEADGCDVTVSAYDVRAGQVTWTAAAGQWHLPEGVWAGHMQCERSAWAPLVTGATMAVTTAGARVQLVELAGGRVRWTGGPDLHALALTDRCVVARNGGNGSLVGLDPADGGRRWESAVPESFGRPVGLDRVTATGDRLLYQYYFVPSGVGGKARNVLRVIDLGSGRLDWIADDSGYLLGAGPGWAVTGADGIEDTDGPKEIRLYAG
ncbi:PQQ-like beta-propeller repeat protein [Dactylosporangium sp. NBC_01737]|uniref:outer membrane protein assembly factor BamB family protein n=1 Tax=Dactylosporangium sp. NBC_01737 TaxID=2975959 RepID=UPI002E112870|nr:PQQ-like beta-propeller repeat protein [Dactylosporangium sp. NBC_01737]